MDTHIIEIFLPLTDNQGKRFPETVYNALYEEMTERFGGVTAFTRAPAQGAEQTGRGAVRDDIVIFEVMTESLDKSWWAALRRRLERQFAQERILIRATVAMRL
jgi:hypothetical protein